MRSNLSRQCALPRTLRWGALRALPGLLLALALLGAAAAPARAQQPSDSDLVRGTAHVGGRDRPYYYYVPEKIDRHGFNQIVFVLHDDGQSAPDFARQSGWIQLADANGFAVVFPETSPPQRGVEAPADQAPFAWAPNTGGEDEYLKAVYDDAVGHMQLPGADPEAGADPASQGFQGAGAPGGHRGPGGRRRGARAGEGGGAGGGGFMATRVRTWFPFQYIVGVGQGARVAQAFVMNHPGIFAAMATLNGGPYNLAYASGDEPSQAYDQYMRAGKSAIPHWRQLKKDVPVATWLFSTGTDDHGVQRQALYWEHADHTGAGTDETVAGLQTTVYRDGGNPANEVRTTVLPDGASFNERLAAAIWYQFFSHVARWTSSPNGTLGRLLTPAEVAQQFQVRTLNVNGKDYVYYLNVPPAYHPGASLPLVLCAHGFGFPAWEYLSQLRMQDVGQKAGFLTVYLQGQDDGWNFQNPDGEDAQYVQQVIADVESHFGADPTRIYMQGFSFGSGLTYMMGIAHPQLFAAVSPNSGIGGMPPAVEQRMADNKRMNLEIPMMIVYGDVDNGGSADGLIPAQGVLRVAIDEMKSMDHISTPDRVERYDSDTTAPYDILVPGGKLVHTAFDRRYPQGRLLDYEYTSDDSPARNLFDFVWVTDMAHAQDPREAQLEWDYFKHWRRNSDGTLTYSAK